MCLLFFIEYGFSGIYNVYSNIYSKYNMHMIIIQHICIFVECYYSSVGTCLLYYYMFMPYMY